MSTPTTAAFHLSAEQARLWLRQATNPAPFVVECEVDIQGPVDSGRLKDSIRRVVASEEILRTAFRGMHGMKTPFQVVEDAADFDWHTGAEPGVLRQILDSPFDLESGRCLRAGLATLASGEHRLLLALPALCADFVSLTNLVDRIGRAYAGGAETEAIQYPDVVEWQRELLTGDEGKAGQDFWRRHFLATDFSLSARPLAALQSSRESGAFLAEILTIYSGAASALASATPEFLLACWVALLARLTGLEDIAVSCGVDGRSFGELHDALGLFAKQIPLALHAGFETPIRDLVALVRERMAEAHNWQDSFPGSEGGDVPFAFEFAKLPPSTDYGPLRFTILHRRVDTESVALKLSVIRSESGLTVEWHFDAARLDRATVERWSRHFLRLAEAAVNELSTPISRLPLLDEDELRVLTEGWNRTESDFPAQSIHELFEAQADRTPDRPAVRAGEHERSYQELNRRANQLAHYLRRNGIHAGTRAGLFMDRGVDLMIALLAILKAGGAYVPLNAEDPPARIAQRLEGVVLLISERNLAGTMPNSGIPVILIDADQELWVSEPETNPAKEGTPDDLAYLIYTSGSTGVPKGVGVRHRNLVNYSCFMRHRLELDRHPEGLHFATVTTISADLGNTCIYPALISGGCVHLIVQEVSSESGRMADYCRRHPIDVLKIVPSHLSALVDTNDSKAILPRKYLICGGEALTWELVDRIYGIGGSCEIFNHYGPSETTIGSLTLRLSDYPRSDKDWERVPIGRPIANTRLYILDAWGQPVPTGVAGELYIGGAGVAAGYLGQPALTGERFLDDPWKPGSKMYRTGDICRYRTDGLVEFLGRGDNQVKIRGYRIETGEVEAALLRYPGLREAVVVARPDSRGDQRLIAYLTASRDRSLQADAVRAHLKESLPPWMIPALVVILPRFPLNVNGKIDRNALPEPEEAAQRNREIVGPRTATERALARIWAEVFRREPISVEDNFFDLGGHSLMATQVVSRLNRYFKVDPPASIVFEFPTIAQLAEWIDRSTMSSAGHAEPLVPVSREGRLALSFAQQRLWVIDQFDAGNPMYNIVRALRIKGNLDESILGRSLNEIVKQHESQRTTFAIRDGEPVQVIAPKLHIPLEVEDVSGLELGAAEARARACAVEESGRRFDLTTGPLLRAKCVRLAEDDRILLLSMHHIVSDGWSAAIFFNDLSAVYTAYASNQVSPLAALSVQYADYAAWQRKTLSGANLARQIDYWRDQLSGAPPSVALPYDHPPGTSSSFAGNYALIALPGDVSTGLAALARRADATLFMTLLAGFQALLAFYSRQDRIVVGTDVANRPNPETEALIGFFVNLLPICTDVSGDPTFLDLLKRVRSSALGAYAHQDLPFDKLVEELQPERRFGHNPIVQTLFVMQNIPIQKQGFAGLDVRPFEIPVGWSKFDLALFMIEREDGLAGCWLYRRDLFEPSTIIEMAARYEALLREVTASPAIRLGALSQRVEEEQTKQRNDRARRKRAQRDKLVRVELKAIDLGGPADKRQDE